MERKGCEDDAYYLRNDYLSTNWVVTKTIEGYSFNGVTLIFFFTNSRTIIGSTHTFFTPHIGIL